MIGDPERFSLTRIGHQHDVRQQMAIDVREGLTGEHRSLPSVYFYDDHGSALFEEITLLPEYYLTRAETEILETHADSIIAAVHPDELVEIGAGYARKTQLLLTAIHEHEAGDVYVAIDVSESALRHAGENLTSSFPWLEVRGYLADFGADLDAVPRRGRRLVAFLGSTVGNLAPHQRSGFLKTVTSMMDDDDAFLLGIDLIKDEAVLRAAYDDSAGLTAQFNKNILTVVNRELGGDFDLNDFHHETRFVSETGCMEQSLRVIRDVDVWIEDIELAVHLDQGDSIHTEWSCKFTRSQVEAELGAAGVPVTEWWTDSEERFALALATRQSPSST